MLGNAPDLQKKPRPRLFLSLMAILLVAIVCITALLTIRQPVRAQAAEAAALAAAKASPAFASCYRSLPEQPSAMLPAFRGDVAREATDPIYNLTFQSDVTSLKYSGHEQLCFFNRTGTTLNDLVLRLYPNRLGGNLEISNLQVAGQTATVTSLEQDSSYVTVKLDTPIQRWALTPIELDYSGTFSNKIGEVPGGYNNGRQAYVGDILALNNFYPQLGVWEKGSGWNTLHIDPRPTDPTYAETSLYNVTLTVPTAQKVLASGVEIETKAATDSITSHRFVTGPVREFATTMSEKYEMLTQEADGITFRSAYVVSENRFTERYARPYAQKVLSDGIASVKSYSRFIGQYPYAKLDYVETNMTVNGIEQPTLIELSKYFYQSPLRPSTKPTDLDAAVAHETAHMWFYNIVGSNQQGHTWIDEGTTEYATSLAPELYASLLGQSSQEVSALRKANETSLTQKAVFDYNRFGKDLVVDRPIGEFGEGVGTRLKDRVVAYLPYEKTPTMYVQYRAKYGDDALFTYLRNLFRDYKYKIAQPEDILKELQRAAPGYEAEVALFFNRWIKEAKIAEDIDTNLTFLPAPTWYGQIQQYPDSQPFDVPKGTLAIFGDPSQIYIEARVVSAKPEDVFAFYRKELEAAGWHVYVYDTYVEGDKGSQSLKVFLVPGATWPEYRPEQASKVGPDQYILDIEAKDDPPLSTQTQPSVQPVQKELAPATKP